MIIVLHIEPKAEPRKVVGIQVEQDLFSGEVVARESEYTTKMGAPVYKPRGRKPSLLELVDDSKCQALISRIAASGISDDEKKFLAKAAQRHLVFFYNNIADYYANATPEMQRLMEESALVIVDIGSAIQNGYAEFNAEVKRLFENETNR